MLFVVDGKLRTFFGWSPGLRITLGGRVLPCGCLVGSYETWDSGVVDVLDAHDDRCIDRAHVTNSVVRFTSTRAVAASPSTS